MGIIWIIWGSLLTLFGNILITGSSIKQFALCDACNTPCTSIHSLPILSWLRQKGICAYCKTPLSSLYIVIPLFSILAFYASSQHTPTSYHAAYSFFFATLIITIFTDAHYMLISRFVTVYLLPIPLLLSVFGMLPLTPHQVMFGALSGYLILAGISYLFSVIMKKQGMGQGDIDLLCIIGAFLGFGGWWISLLVASSIGSVFGIFYLFTTNQGKETKIPFGPFLALGAMIYTIWAEQLFALLFPIL